MLKRIGLIAAMLLSTIAVSDAHLNLYCPTAAIEYTAGTFVKTASGGVLQDVVRGQANLWLNNNVSSVTQIQGYAHIGMSGMTQTQANQRIALVQIWGWKDTNGDGMADVQDSQLGTHTTKWILLSQLHPSQSSGDGSGGNVVGWNTNDPVGTSGWSDILQVGAGKGTAIALHPGDSWLLLIRVVDIVGNTNLQSIPGGIEQWDDGDTSNGVGSDVPVNKYVDEKGNTPGTSTNRINDKAIVWIYVPRT